MFTLITGVPGSGKTLWLVNHLKDGLKLPNSDQKRPIYYYGIPGVSPDLGWIPLENPLEWHTEVPDGAVVVIDECQEHFPVRSPKVSVPAGLQAIERHRHRGLDLFFMTQHPSLLDHHARRLAGAHNHLKRNFGANFSVLYSANEVMADPQDYHTLQKAEKTTFKHPKDTFHLYKSAEVHTHKMRIPKVLYVMLALIAFVALMVYIFVNTLFGEDESITESSIASPKSMLVDSLTEGQGGKYITIKSLMPLIPNTPASSVVYQKQWQPKSVPILSACIGTDENCSCYSQQGTKVLTTHEYCVSVLKNGSIYDHTLPDNRFKNKDKNHDKQHA